MPIDKKSLGAAIRQVRTARGMSQAELAQAAGLSKGGNSEALIERGERFVSLDTLNALAEALRIPPACLSILGSSHLEGSDEATELMRNLQDLVSSVVEAQALMRVEEEAERTKREKIQTEKQAIQGAAAAAKNLRKSLHRKSGKQKRVSSK